MWLAAAALGCALGAVCGAGGAMADMVKVSTLIAVKEEYNDNFLFYEKQKEDDWITTISPGLKLVRKDDRLDALLRVVGHRVIYADHSELNAWDQDYQARTAYQLTQRHLVSARAGYTRDSRTDRDFEETGLVLGTSTRERYQAGVSAEWQASELALLSLSYDFARDDFEAPDQTDSRIHGVRLGFTRRLPLFGRPTCGVVSLGWTDYDYESRQIDNYSLGLGIQREVSERLAYSFRAGGRYSDSRYEVPVLVWHYNPDYQRIVGYRFRYEDRTDASWGAVGEASLTYKLAAFISLAASASHDVSPASGRSGTTERTAFRLDLDGILTASLTGGMAAEYYLNRADKNELAGEEIEEETLRLEGRLRYEICRDLFLTGTYVFAKTWDEVEDREIARNVVSLRLDYLFDWLD